MSATSNHFWRRGETVPLGAGPQHVHDAFETGTVASEPANLRSRFRTTWHATAVVKPLLNDTGAACSASCVRTGVSLQSAAMVHYFKFRQDLFAPQPGREVYVKPGPGKGWPEECPPIRAANAFGYDLLANFDVTFIQSRGRWRVERDVVIESDFAYAAREDSEGQPLRQQYAWFWEKGQKLPHVISDHVYEQIKNQVKVSSFLFLATDPNELLYLTEVPNLQRPWRAMTAVVDTDWYPASYPWHVVLALERTAKRVTIRKGEPLCRIIPVRRDTYFAREMPGAQFDDFFARGQKWLAVHGQVEHEGTVDITHTYVRQQVRSKFMVIE